MDEHDERRHAAEALATIFDRQQRARRAARRPWWIYAAMFVLIPGLIFAAVSTGLFAPAR